MALTALCIIALFLGVMGFLGGAMGLVGLVLNPKQQAPNPNPKLKDLNAEFEQRMERVMKESRPVLLALHPASMLLSVLLAVAGIAGLKMSGRPFIQAMFAGNLIVDTIAAILNIMIQTKTISVMTWYFRESASESNMPRSVATGMQFGLYTGMFFAGAWLLMKTAFYVWGVVYFGMKSVRAAFQGRPSGDVPITP